MPRPIDALVLVSDLHCGSEVGLVHPRAPINDKGNVVDFGENAHQAWLWDRWQAMEASVLSALRGRRWALVVNGDCTEGIHHHSPEVIATRIEIHAKIAVRCLERLALAAVVRYLTAGTECHTLGLEN